MIAYTTVESPVDDLLLVASPRGLRGIYMREHRRGPRVSPDWRPDAGVFADAHRQLDEYFAGERLEFDLPLDPVGTPFQQHVWKTLRTIAFGEVITYGDLALRASRPGAARAVGSANARNPLSIVVPCHRVVGGRGALTGYAGGLDRKQHLLAHERALRSQA